MYENYFSFWDKNFLSSSSIIPKDIFNRIEWMKSFFFFKKNIWSKKIVFMRNTNATKHTLGQKKRRVWTNPLRCLGWICFACECVCVCEGERDCVYVWVSVLERERVFADTSIVGNGWQERKRKRERERVDREKV